MLISIELLKFVGSQNIFQDEEIYINVIKYVIYFYLLKYVYI